MAKFTITLICFAVITINSAFSQSIVKNEKLEYQPNLVVFKLKSLNSSQTFSRTLSSSYNELLPEEIAKKVKAKHISPAFPKKSTSSNARLSTENSVLDGIYKLELSDDQSIEDAIASLKKIPGVAYAEPYYLPEPLEVTNDPLISNQKHLGIIKAFEAWDLEKGSKDVIIAIIDTGVDFNHPDLKDNLYLNEADPVDGIDNDNDGYIDNYRGWDFANYDNDPTADLQPHGTAVTGFASATPNNGIGVAGTSYGCRYMPLKVFSSRNGVFNNGYEAIVYAADKGCKVINLSWGSRGGKSQYVQDIINYAVLEKDVVVVAAAGNTNAELDFFPASYNHVLSVSSSNYLDEKASYATYSRFVDLVAPGLDVYTTKNGSNYGLASGTSHATPQVSGAAALIRSKHPHLNALQVMELLRVTTKDISQVPVNLNYKERIGKGQLDMYKAMLPNPGPAVRMTSYKVNNGVGPYMFYGDTVEIQMNFTNYLDPTANLKVNLSSPSPYVTMIDSVTTLGTISTLESKSNAIKVFKIYLHEDLPPDSWVPFRIGFEDGSYLDYQYLDIRSSGDYIDFHINDMILTVASNGNLGYNYDYNLMGLGLRYKDLAIAHNMGLLIGTDSKHMANNMISYLAPTIRDQDFSKISGIKLTNLPIADKVALSSFEVVSGDSTNLNLLVEQKILGWNDFAPSSAIILQYRIINRSDTSLRNLNASLFTDFDLGEFNKNKATWDAANKLGYVYDQSNQTYAGIALLSGQEAGYHALDLGGYNQNTAEVGNEISRKKKFSFISDGLNKTVAGVKDPGNDVAQFLVGKIAELPAHSSVKIGFAILKADNLASLQAASQLAQQKFSSVINNPPVLASATVCKGEDVVITFESGTTYRFYSGGESKILVAEGNSFTHLNTQKDTIFYAAQVFDTYEGDYQQIQIHTLASTVDFSMVEDTIVVDKGESVSVQFTNLSPSTNTWSWNSSNGLSSTDQNPTFTYSIPSTYDISLTATNENGCQGKSIKQLVILEREQTPTFANQVICKDATVSFTVPPDQTLNIYSDAGLQDLIYQGMHYTSSPLKASTSLYVTKGEGLVESKPQQVEITVLEPVVNISHQFDKSMRAKYAVNLVARTNLPTNYRNISWFVNNQKVGSQDSIWYMYNPVEVNELLVKLVIDVVTDCQIVLEKTITLKPGEVPQLSNINTCSGEAVEIIPSNMGIFYFYGDSTLSTLLYKGESFKTKPLYKDQTYFVTNGNLGKESSASKVSINVPEKLGMFTTSSDTLFLSQGDKVSFQSLASDATEWLWTINGIKYKNHDPIAQFDKTGIYKAQLTARNALGCQGMQSKNIVVLFAPGHHVRNERSEKRIHIFPNPAETDLNIILPVMDDEIIDIKIIDTQGKPVFEKHLICDYSSLLSLDITGFTQGMYTMLITCKESSYVTRFLVKK